MKKTNVNTNSKSEIKLAIFANLWQEAIDKRLIKKEYKFDKSYVAIYPNLKTLMDYYDGAKASGGLTIAEVKENFSSQLNDDIRKHIKKRNEANSKENKKSPSVVTPVIKRTPPKTVDPTLSFAASVRNSISTSRQDSSDEDEPSVPVKPRVQPKKLVFDSKTKPRLESKTKPRFPDKIKSPLEKMWEKLVEDGVFEGYPELKEFKNFLYSALTPSELTSLDSSEIKSNEFKQKLVNYIFSFRAPNREASKIFKESENYGHLFEKCKKIGLVDSKLVYDKKSTFLKIISASELTAFYITFLSADKDTKKYLKKYVDARFSRANGFGELGKNPNLQSIFKIFREKGYINEEIYTNYRKYLVGTEGYINKLDFINLLKTLSFLGEKDVDLRLDFFYWGFNAYLKHKLGDNNLKFSNIPNGSESFSKKNKSKKNKNRDLVKTIEEKSPEPEPIQSQVELVSEVQPDVEEVQPDVEEVQPDVEEVQPDVEESQPDVEESQPDVEESQPNSDEEDEDEEESQDQQGNVPKSVDLPDTESESEEEEF
jgi:hypothetical protein